MLQDGSELTWKYSSQLLPKLGLGQQGVMKVPETSPLADSPILQVREPRSLPLKPGLFTSILDSECPEGVDQASLFSASLRSTKNSAPYGYLEGDS